MIFNLMMMVLSFSNVELTLSTFLSVHVLCVCVRVCVCVWVCVYVCCVCVTHTPHVWKAYLNKERWCAVLKVSHHGSLSDNCKLYSTHTLQGHVHGHNFTHSQFTISHTCSLNPLMPKRQTDIIISITKQTAVIASLFHGDKTQGLISGGL